mmetsp:Transcript_86598/g.245153  ORF Transcript_86598/g.245153 Transcript_86598/m.245153 type:complete len:340 (+) Transcript_86598:799-1818(+)
MIDAAVWSRGYSISRSPRATCSRFRTSACLTISGRNSTSSVACSAFGTTNSVSGSTDDLAASRFVPSFRGFTGCCPDWSTCRMRNGPSIRNLHVTLHAFLLLKFTLRTVLANTPATCALPGAPASVAPPARPLAGCPSSIRGAAVECTNLNTGHIPGTPSPSGSSSGMSCWTGSAFLSTVRRGRMQSPTASTKMVDKTSPSGSSASLASGSCLRILPPAPAWAAAAAGAAAASSGRGSACTGCLVPRVAAGSASESELSSSPSSTGGADGRASTSLAAAGGSAAGPRPRMVRSTPPASTPGPPAVSSRGDPRGEFASSVAARTVSRSAVKRPLPKRWYL